MMLFILTGCHQRDIIENIGFIHTLGFDLADDADKLRVTVSFPFADKREDRTISTLAYTNKEARIYLSNQSDKNLVAGQARSILIGKKLAEQGIWKQIDTIYRDTIFRPNIKLAVVEGEAQQLMESQFEDLAEMNQSLEDLLNKEARLNTIPDIDIHKFARDYLDDAVDPIAPMIKKTDTGMMATGIALFKDDQYVTSLDTIQSRIFFLMTGDFKEGDLFIKTDNETIFIDFLSNRQKTDVSFHSPEDIHIDIKIEFTSYLLEYQGDQNISTDQGIERLEEVIEQYIEDEIKKIVQIMKQYEIDNAGYGKYIRMKTDYQTWKKMNWPESVDHITVTPHVDVKILDTGLLNR